LTKVTWASLTSEQQDQLVAAYVAGESIKPTLSHLGIQAKASTIERSIREYLYYYKRFVGNIFKTVSVPDSLNEPYQDYKIIEADDALVISDLEIPDQDGYMLRAALLTAMKYDIKRLIYNGDVLATDQDSLNTWVKDFRGPHEVSYKTAVDQTRQLMVEYAKWFNEQYFVTGNHDNRIARKTGGEVYLEMLLADTGVTFSRYGYMFMKTSRGWIYICHPQNYSIHAASKLGNDLWATTLSPDKTKCHVVLGHTHLAQVAWSPDGQQEIVSTGCLRRQAQYKDTNANTHRQWQKGFLVIKNGFFYVFTERGTDWQAELEDLYPLLGDRHV